MMFVEKNKNHFWLEAFIKGLWISFKSVLESQWLAWLEGNWRKVGILQHLSPKPGIKSWKKWHLGKETFLKLPYTWCILNFKPGQQSFIKLLNILQQVHKIILKSTFGLAKDYSRMKLIVSIYLYITQ